MHNSILIVEADHDIAMLLVALLRAQDCFAVSTASGYDALDMLDEVSPVLVFADAAMPDMDLDEFVACLRERSAAPLVLMSTHTDGQHLACKICASAYLPLPFELSEVLSCLYLMPATLERWVG